MDQILSLLDEAVSISCLIVKHNPCACNGVILKWSSTLKKIKLQNHG